MRYLPSSGSTECRCRKSVDTICFNIRGSVIPSVARNLAGRWRTKCRCSAPPGRPDPSLDARDDKLFFARMKTRIAVVGGGTSGFMAAVHLSHYFPSMDVV